MSSPLRSMFRSSLADLALASIRAGGQDSEPLTLIVPDEAMNQSGEPAVLEGADIAQLDVLETSWVQVNGKLISSFQSDLIEAGPSGGGGGGADLNHDGVVDEDDEDLLTGNYGGDCD
jgi:hypothetical protein